MPRRGRPPKPAYLKLITDNPGRRSIKGELKVAPAVSPPPDHLGEEARAEWQRVAAMLAALGLFTPLDHAVLGAYCQSYAMWKQATEALKDQELVVKSAKGNSMANILLGIANVAAANMLRFATEFGMTPVARSRLGGSVQTGPGKFDGLIGGRDPAEKYFND